MDLGRARKKKGGNGPGEKKKSAVGGGKRAGSAKGDRKGKGRVHWSKGCRWEKERKKKESGKKKTFKAIPFKSKTTKPGRKGGTGRDQKRGERGAIGKKGRQERKRLATVWGGKPARAREGKSGLLLLNIQGAKKGEGRCFGKKGVEGTGREGSRTKKRGEDTTTRKEGKRENNHPTVEKSAVFGKKRKVQ